MKLSLSSYGNVVPTSFWNGIDWLPAKFVDGLTVGDFATEVDVDHALVAMTALPESEYENILNIGFSLGSYIIELAEGTSAAPFAERIITNNESFSFREVIQGVTEADEAFKQVFTKYIHLRTDSKGINRQAINNISELAAAVVKVNGASVETINEVLKAAIVSAYPVTAA